MYTELQKEKVKHGYSRYDYCNHYDYPHVPLFLLYYYYYYWYFLSFLWKSLNHAIQTISMTISTTTHCHTPLPKQMSFLFSLIIIDVSRSFFIIFDALSSDYGLLVCRLINAVLVFYCFHAWYYNVSGGMVKVFHLVPSKLLLLLQTLKNLGIVVHSYNSL